MVSYGDEKGACEMIFSYGFLEDGSTTAYDLFLDLQLPNDDPLGRAKKAVSTCAPGVRLIVDPQGVRWEGDYVYLICVNEEDGLQFELVQTTDGEQELQVLWQGQDLSDTSKLKALLQSNPLWHVYNLRAVSIIQVRVEQQLQRLYSTAEVEKRGPKEDTGIREGPWKLAMKLRELETELLEQAYADFEDMVRSKWISGSLILIMDVLDIATIVSRLTKMGASRRTS